MTAFGTDSLDRTAEGSRIVGWWFGAVAARSLGVLFLTAGIVKAVDLDPLTRALLAYRIAGGVWVDTLAAGLASVEIVLGMALLGAASRRAALLAAAVLLATFAIALAPAAAAGIGTDCGCFGSAAQSPGAADALTRAGALLCLTLLALGLPGGPPRRSNHRWRLKRQPDNTL